MCFSYRLFEQAGRSCSNLAACLTLVPLFLVYYAGVNARFSIGDEEEELSEVQLGETPAAAEGPAAQALSPVNKQD